MYLKRDDRPVSVTGLNGEIITRSDLPSPSTQRWVARRKAVVVAAVNGGMLEAGEACEMYGLSEEEFDGWCEMAGKHGVNALRSPERASLVITHYQRLLDYIVPDFVHVLLGGRIVRSGGKDLALELEERGYGWLQEEARSGRAVG